MAGAKYDRTSSQFGDGSLSYWGPDTAEFADFNQAYIFDDNVTWVKGRHTISTGVEYRHINDENRFGTSPVNGLYGFNPGQPLLQAVTSASGQNNLPVGAPSPSSLVSFIEGDPFQYQKGIQFPGWPTLTLSWLFREHYRAKISFDIMLMDGFRTTSE